MASLHRLELLRGHRLLLLDDRERDAPVVGIRAGRHHALEHLVGKRLVRQDGDLALGDIALAHLLADQHRQEVDEGNEVKMRIRAVPQVMQRHAPGAIRHAHGRAPLALAAGARISAATGFVGAATGAAATGAAAAPGGSSGASPIEMSGKSSACTEASPWLTSNTRTRSMTCTSVS